MKTISRLLWLPQALTRARSHNVSIHHGEKCAEVEIDEGSAELLDRVTRRYKVVCRECKGGRKWTKGSKS